MKAKRLGDTTKILGCTGAFIVFFESPLPGIPNFNIIKIAGILVVLFSLYNLANFYQSKNIFNNARIGALITIIGFISVMIGGGIAPRMPSYEMWTYTMICTNFVGGVFFTVAAFFVRRSLNELAVHSDISLFKTAAIVLFIGAILSTILIGVLIMWIAFLILAIAFFKMSEKPSTPLSNTHSPLTVLVSNVKANFCPNCGTSLQSDVIFCPNCGKQT
ncbi:MAG: DUF996 domain-containing protein [Candidatus Bathyarchaeota archaeon]|nr:DUF996 domain-containing protein [Candidatus Termiticorpusculum sp.]